MNSAACLLIAGAGDLGMRVARLRAARGEAVLALRRSDAPAEAGIQALRADLASGDGFQRLPRRPDALLFCAAPGERTETAYRTLYLDGLRRLLDRLQVARVLFVSSTAVYAQDAGEWVDEDSPTEPTAFNGRILLQAEHELEGHANGSSLRLSGLYGPGRESALRRAREGRLDGNRWGNRIHVADAALAASGLLDLAQPPGRVLGSDDSPTPDHELQAWVRAQEGLPALGGPTGETRGRRIGNARLRATGWVPAFPDYRAGYSPLLNRADL